jgi:hypothetical protein
MKIISFIDPEQRDVIDRMLTHCWLSSRAPPPSREAQDHVLDALTSARNIEFVQDPCPAGRCGPTADRGDRSGGLVDTRLRRGGCVRRATESRPLPSWRAPPRRRQAHGPEHGRDPGPTGRPNWSFRMQAGSSSCTGSVRQWICARMRARVSAHLRAFRLHAVSLVATVLPMLPNQEDQQWRPGNDPAMHIRTYRLR